MLLPGKGGFLLTYSQQWPPRGADCPAEPFKGLPKPPNVLKLLLETTSGFTIGSGFQLQFGVLGSPVETLQATAHLPEAGVG